ncbi:MAG: hypothetical protein RLZZ628_35 [Bacteroidota bacterium]|jgi:CxxC motif-containing protein (DUF1111 family)
MNKTHLLVFGLILLIFGFVTSCEKLTPALPNADEVMDGPLDGLTGAENRQHLEGAAEFDEVYVPETGLGSIFVSNSCVSCHAGVGKGHLFTTLTRFGQSDTTGNKMLHLGAPQLQNRALPGFQPETLPAGASAAQFTPPINAGLGLLELVSDAAILAMSDPNDVNGDGISGIPNWNHIPKYVIPKTNAIVQKGKYICRFGKKASVYDLLQQTANAFNQDMGVTSIFEPKDPYTHLELDPEVSATNIQKIVFYLQTLQTPIQRTPNDANVLIGNQLFMKIGCNDCHKETLQTGDSPVAALSNQTFHPYTDLLLHDMGDGLNDHYTEGSALASEWRTPPLWGLGLSPISQGGNYFLLHDGRARSIEQAIEMHGGEATNSKNKYVNLNPQDKTNLLQFLKSL